MTVVTSPYHSSSLKTVIRRDYRLHRAVTVAIAIAAAAAATLPVVLRFSGCEHGRFGTLGLRVRVDHWDDAAPGKRCHGAGGLNDRDTAKTHRSRWQSLSAAAAATYVEIESRCN